MAFFRFVFDKRAGALIYVLKTSIFAFTLVAAVISVAIALDLAKPYDTQIASVPQEVFGALVIAPLFENICFILIAEFFLALRLGWTTVILIVASLSAVGHGIVADWRAVAGFVMFAVMTYSYLLWSEKPFGRRYLLTVAQHTLLNVPFASALVISVLD